MGELLQPDPRMLCSLSEHDRPSMTGGSTTLTLSHIIVWQAGRRMLLLERDLPQPGP